MTTHTRRSQVEAIDVVDALFRTCDLIEDFIAAHPWTARTTYHVLGCALLNCRVALAQLATEFGAEDRVAVDRLDQSIACLVHVPVTGPLPSHVPEQHPPEAPAGTA